MQFAHNSVNMDEVVGVTKLSHAAQNSTPVKLVVEARRVARSLSITSVRPLVKRISNVDSGIDESSEGLDGCVRPAIFRKFALGIRSETMTSVGGVTTDTFLT